MKRLLIIDDEPGTRESIQAIFAGTYEVLTAENAAFARSLVNRHHFDLLILDVIMPGMSGITFLREIREVFPTIPVIMISASYSDCTVQEARNLHAVGFLCKPFDIHELRNLVAQTLRASEATRQQFVLNREISRLFPLNVIGDSPAIHHALEAARIASQSDAPVVITGEHGSGRELFARQVHAWGRRGPEPFIKIECGRSDAATLEREIFGTAPTGLDTPTRPGAIDLAGGGALFLAEAQLLSPALHRRVRNAIEHREFQRCGGEGRNVPHVARFFLSCSDTKPLGEELATIVPLQTLAVPPLRARAEDIPLLTTHLMNQLRPVWNARMSSVEPSALRLLKSYAWPGNVREMRNVIERILALHRREEVLRADFLPREISGDPLPSLDPAAISFHEATDRLHRQMIARALRSTRGVIKNAAALLQVTPRILQHRIDKLNIDVRNP